MSFKDKLGRPVPSTRVYNRSDKNISEDFPVIGRVSIRAGEIKDIPAEVAELWCSRERWERKEWPQVPITKDLPGARAPEPEPEAADEEEEEEEAEAPTEEDEAPTSVSVVTPPTIVSRPKGRR